MDFRLLLEKLLEKENLSQKEAETLMRLTMEGQLSSVQIAAYLSALRTKGETAEEIAGFAQAMRQMAISLPTRKRPLVDTCGTGGDKAQLINISTLTALTLASLGIPVAKHGNRAVSSQSGSADLLEKLGYPLNESPEKAALRLEKTNFCFLFAPEYHPAMKNVAPVRKELGVRTVFNILGPLTNPAKAEIQLLGIFDPNRLFDMALALKELGVHQAMVIHGSGIDEIHPILPTKYCLFLKNELKEAYINPKDLALKEVSLSEIQAKNGEEALAKAKAFLEGKNLSAVETVALNAAIASYLYDVEVTNELQELKSYCQKKIPEIREHILSGKVNEWCQFAFSNV